MVDFVYFCNHFKTNDSKISFHLYTTLFGVASPNRKKIDHKVLWTRYYNQLLLSEKWSLHSEIDNRFYKTHSAKCLCVACARTLQNKQPSGNRCWFGSFSVTTQIPEINPTLEFLNAAGNKTWLGISGKKLLNQRFQVEERFIHNANSIGLLGSFFMAF
jgi:hypothetical protein